MFRIEKMKAEEKEAIMHLVVGFYHSPAVSHAVSRETLEATFDAAVAGDQGLDGYAFMEDDTVVGFAYVTQYFACEVGGKCVVLEELCLDEKTRGKGYGTRFFRFFFENYAYAKRFRLEVSKDNSRVVALYRKLGFEFLDYGQMVRDML